MSPWLRLTLFLVVSVLFLYGQVLLAFLIVAVACLFIDAYEYALLAFCIDVYFAPVVGMFWYTAGVMGLILCMFTLRPYVRSLDN